MPTAEAPRHRRYVHELICGMCGRKVDDVYSAQPNPPAHLFSARRCAVCDGQSVFSGERSYQEVDVPVFVDDPLRPRVGRPPKWVLAARAAAAAALEADDSLEVSA